MKQLQNVSKAVQRCNRVGKCKGWDPLKISPCPIMLASGGLSANSPKGLMIAAQEILDDANILMRDLANIAFKCTACGNCTQLCASFGEDGKPLTQPDVVIQALKSDALDAGLVPKSVKRYLENIYGFGNAFAASPETRGALWDDGGAPDLTKHHDYLFYVGDLGSFDKRIQRTAKDVARLFTLAGVSFGVLGKVERSDGNEVKYLGEDTLFEHLAGENIEKFNANKVTRIVALSPHAFNAFKREYPALGADFEVVHYTELLSDLLDQGKLKPQRAVNARVTYHDPCFLGRKNGVYNAPRSILKAIPGLTFIEMARHGKNALCCGGGGANAFTDVLGGGKNAPSVNRLDEACSVNVEIMAVACPQCTTMFAGALPLSQIPKQLSIQDVAELLLTSCEKIEVASGEQTL